MATPLDGLDELAGRLVRLRGPRTEDGPAFLALDRDTEGTRRWNETSLPQTDERSRAWLEREVAEVRTDGRAFLVIERLEDQAVVGPLRVWRASARNGRFSYGIAVGHDFRGAGYGSEAIVLLLRFYFGELRYQKCDTTIHAYNEGSLRLHERLGFQVEGRIRRATFTAGAFHDELVVGITAEEFAARHPA